MTNLLSHIAIICDGNRRWAKKRNLPEFSGHRYAVEHTVEKLIKHAIALKIPYLTFWVLSTENWRRGKKWITQYFQIMRYFLKKNLKKLIKEGVKIKAIGNLAKLPQDIQQKIYQLEKESAKNKKINVIIAINYGGRDEILRAINKILEKPRKKLTLPIFEKCLDTAGIPDPDLLIRTGKGNNRLSGFMLWQTAYTELYFTDTLFPDLTPKEFDKAIAWFKKQKRNFGR